MPRLLDLFCGRWGWSRAFAARGWECIGVDIVRPPEIPLGCHFMEMDVLKIYALQKGTISWEPWQAVCKVRPDFIVASSPCEEFSVYGMAHFHPSPKYPELGIKLFNHTRQLCESSGLPYVMENVRPAQRFVGRASHICGPFALWGTGVPPLMPQGITKGFGKWDRKYIITTGSSKSKRRAELKAKLATIPPELANCVAEYAERILEQKSECA